MIILMHTLCMNMISCERFVTCSDSKVGRLLSPIECMSFSMSYAGLSANTFFGNYELTKTLYEFHGSLCLLQSGY